MGAIGALEGVGCCVDSTLTEKSGSLDKELLSNGKPATLPSLSFQLPKRFGKAETGLVAKVKSWSLVRASFHNRRSWSEPRSGEVFNILFPTLIPTVGAARSKGILENQFKESNFITDTAPFTYSDTVAA
jgi:hypothetical protein